MDKLVLVEEALSELGLEMEDFVEFLGDLRAFLDEAVPELATAVAKKDFVEIRAKAHAIKGALANLRFVAAAQVAYSLETKGRESRDESLEADITALKDVLERSFAELA